MKLETVLGIIVGIVFIGGVVFYNTHKEPSVPPGSPEANLPPVVKGEKPLNKNDIPSKKEEIFLSAEQKAAEFNLAPEISSPDGFINTDGRSITLGEFRGKSVVLLDIWTYSCINCQRTIPYLNEWYKKYKDQGLVIIGLHTPEFSFEKVQKNVEEAVKNFGIRYPVVLDNDFSTWNAYGNQYWPRKYLVDIDGYIVYDHAGEGEYAQTERRIQQALTERNARFNIKTSTLQSIADPSGKIAVEANKVNSPEIYFGSARNNYLANGKRGISGLQTLTIPTDTMANQLYLGGTWNFASEYAEPEGEGGTVVFKYNAQNVYMVASSTEEAAVEIYLDGKLEDTVSVRDEKLYQIIQGAGYGEHTIMLKLKNPGPRIFTFTFG